MRHRRLWRIRKRDNGFWYYRLMSEGRWLSTGKKDEASATTVAAEAMRLDLFEGACSPRSLAKRIELLLSDTTRELELACRSGQIVGLLRSAMEHLRKQV